MPGTRDTTRIVQGVVTGMSFPGAGAIIRGEHRIHVITTGAGICPAGAPGLIFGVGLYKPGSVVLLFGLFILIFIRMIEPRDIKERRLTLERRAELKEPAGSKPTGPGKTKDI